MSYQGPSQYSSSPAGDRFETTPQQESAYGTLNPYEGAEQYELQPVSPGLSDKGQYGAPSPTALSQQEFLQRVSHVRNDIRSLASDVQRIASLHNDALASPEDGAQRRLDDIVASTQLKNTSIRDQIRSLKMDVERTIDGTAPMKRRQMEALNGDFQKELQNYLQEEQQYRERYRDQIARQYRIVNPEASEDEVQQAADADWGNESVFQAALRSNRSGQATAVLGRVRARHNELVRIEKSITELAEMFQDLDTLVVAQEPIVERAEEQTEQTNQHLQEGNKQVDIGIVHARRTRKMKWWCALIVLLLLVAIGLGVGLGVHFANK